MIILMEKVNFRVNRVFSYMWTETSCQLYEHVFCFLRLFCHFCGIWCFALFISSLFLSVILFQTMISTKRRSSSTGRSSPGVWKLWLHPSQSEPTISPGVKMLTVSSLITLLPTHHLLSRLLKCPLLSSPWFQLSMRRPLSHRRFHFQRRLLRRQRRSTVPRLLRKRMFPPLPSRRQHLLIWCALHKSK